MKITKITTYRLPPRWMFLKIETDEGVVGWGEPVIEGRARTVEAAVHELSDYLIGQDPSRNCELISESCELFKFGFSAISCSSCWAANSSFLIFNSSFPKSSG